MKKVLILEDEAAIRSFAAVNLKRAGYEPLEAATGERALQLLRENPDIDVAVLDSTLPDTDGFELCRAVRTANRTIGIVVLIARSQETDKVTGLMTGADDNLLKPFSPAELTARIDALCRRGGAEEDPRFVSCPPFLMDMQKRTVEKNGRPIRLTQVEYAILQMFLRNPGRVLSREDIFNAVWGKEHEGELKLVDVNIRRLRIKIEDNTATPTCLTTVWGFGYKWGV